MTNYHLELSFQTGEMVSPVARIYVQVLTGRDGDPHRYIGQDCATMSELEGVLKRLRAELDNIERKARGKFAAAR